MTDPTGENTNYTYTPTGQIATATIYPGGSHGVTTTYTYDAAGNVIQTVQTGTYNGQTLSTTTSATYDVLGRLLSSTDALGRTTRYDYTVSSTGTTVTETLPDGTTQEVQKYALDGMLSSTTGSAVSDPSAGDEGVVTSTLNEPGNITIPAGSTWTLNSTNNGSDWTKIYTNLLGQQFYTQQSGSNGTIVTTDTTYDGNGRPIAFQDVDGSVTHTEYNPYDGTVLDTWVDTNGNGVYDPGVDSKTTNTVTASTTDPTASVGTKQTDLSASGNQLTTDYSSNSGLNTTTTSNGLTTSTSTSFTGSDGTVTVSTTNPDGTRIVDNYTEGLLMSEVQEGTDGSTLTTVTYGYDALRRNISVQDWETAPTTFTLRPDGSVQSMQLPDGRTETVNSQDADTQLPTDVTRLDGQHVTQSMSPAGQTTGQSGAGITPATYGYDPVTGQLSSLTIFPSGSSTDTTGQETTGWKYGLSTGLLSTKTYADGSTDTFTYNNKLQLSLEGLRGGIGVSFGYNAAGMETGATYTDYNTETKIQDSLGTLDDLGRSHVMTELTTSANGQSTSTSDVLSYNAQGQVASEAQASGVTVHYEYNADSSIQDMKLYQNGQVISETDYAYDPISKRLATITINGITYTYTYKQNTNLVSSVGTSANTVSYGYESNTGRLQSITATDSSSTDYSANYTYTANDQRQTENVLQENPDTQATDQRDWTFGYDSQDELASVTDTNNGATLYSYNYDGVGNRTDAGSVNSMNQYSGLQYNGQGDVINDGLFSYTWDAKNRLTSATPDSPDAQSQRDVFTYDPENRRAQEDIYAWNNDQGWVYASSLKFVYDGSQIVAELDGQNHLLQTYTWGPTGTLLSITDYSGSTVKNYQIVADGSGSVVELLDSSTGLVAASYQYDPWGNPLSATGAAGNVSPFRWQGEFYDASFGGYYMGAREGSARLHIFLSPDPSGEGSDPNLERMVGNDPINEGDRTGLASEKDVTGDYYGGLDAVNRDPTLLANPTSKYFMPTIVVRSIFWDGPIMIAKGIRTAFGEAKSGLADELSKTPANATGERAALRTAQGFIYGSEPITYGSFLTGQAGTGMAVGELAPAWALNAAKASAPVVIPAVTGFQIGRMVAAPSGSLQVEDYMDLAALALTWRALPGVGQPVAPEGQVTLGANRFFKLPPVQSAALKDMAAEDLAELSTADREFYSTPNNNSLRSLAPAQGYSLRSRTGGDILKYGETTAGTRRYSQRYLDQIQADMVFEAEGSKAEMHAWQNSQILRYKAANAGARPPLNKTDY